VFAKLILSKFIFNVKFICVALTDINKNNFKK